MLRRNLGKKTPAGAGDLILLCHKRRLARLGKSAEERGRRWIVTEWILEYVRAAAERFKASPGFWLNPAIASC